MTSVVDRCFWAENAGASQRIRDFKRISAGATSGFERVVDHHYQPLAVRIGPGSYPHRFTPAKTARKSKPISGRNCPRGKPLTPSSPTSSENGWGFSERTTIAYALPCLGSIYFGNDQRQEGTYHARTFTQTIQGPVRGNRLPENDPRQAQKARQEQVLAQRAT